MVAMFVNGSGQNEQDLPQMLPTKFHFIWLREFQRRRLKGEKLTDDGPQVMANAHIAFGKVS
jgi:hypothetical protein